MYFFIYYACDKLKVSYRRINQTIVGIFQVLVWKTNFDQMDFSELLKTHKQRSEADPAPTVADIAPKVQRPTSASTTSSRGTGKVNIKLYLMSLFKNGTKPISTDVLSIIINKLSKGFFSLVMVFCIADIRGESLLALTSTVVVHEHAQSS